MDQRPRRLDEGTRLADALSARAAREDGVDSDRDRDTHSVATLGAFLDRFGDVIAASADLGVHPNTFRYRLRRALDTAGIDIDDPVERLMAHLQLRLLDEPDGLQ